MKKFVVVFALFVVFLVSGCDKKEEDVVDLSKHPDTVELTDDNLYGEVLHVPTFAKIVFAKKFKFSDHLHGYGLAIDNKKGVKNVVTLICDTRINVAGISYLIKNDQGKVPEGDNEIALLRFRSDIKDIREADDNQNAIFSTADGDTDFQAALYQAAGLPADTLLGFVIDGRNLDNTYSGVAWTPLFTAGQLKETLNRIPAECNGLKLDLNSVYLVAVSKDEK